MRVGSASHDLATKSQDVHACRDLMVDRRDIQYIQHNLHRADEADGVWHVEDATSSFMAINEFDSKNFLIVHKQTDCPEATSLFYTHPSHQGITTCSSCRFMSLQC